MRLTNEKLGIDIELSEGFTQAQYEKYQTVLVEGVEGAKVNAVIERMIIQAAIDSKILAGITQPLTDLKPKAVKWLTEKVRDFISSETEVSQD